MPITLEMPNLQKQLAEAEARLAKARAKLAAAQADLAKAKASVDGFSNTIRDKERQRDEQSKKEVCTTQRVWVPTPSWRHPFAGHHEDRTLCVPDANALARAAALQVEISGLYVSRGTAMLALTAIQAVVSAAEAEVAADQRNVDALKRQMTAPAQMQNPV